MDRLSEDLCLKIFRFLDHQSVATSHQVCRKWKVLASDNNLWHNLFKERWGGDGAAFFAPIDSRSWKDVYEVQDRCDRVGLGLKIIREGSDYYLVHQGEIQRYLGSRSRREGEDSTFNSEGEIAANSLVEEDESREGILNRILFFVGELEIALTDAKRCRMTC